MKIATISVDNSQHPMIPEGFYSFEDFEHLARVAADLTSAVKESEGQTCIDLTAYGFGDLAPAITGHLHIHRMANYGFMDWIGSVMAETDNPEILEALSQISRTLH